MLWFFLLLVAFSAGTFIYNAVRESRDTSYCGGNYNTEMSDLLGDGPEELDDFGMTARG